MKDACRDFILFKNWFFCATDEEIANLYRRTAHVQELQGETDLNKECINAILRLVQNKNVVEAGCGRGFLAGKLANNNSVTACDIGVQAATRQKYPDVDFIEAPIEKLPLDANSFDIAISTHTLEHVRDVGAAMRELRRVATSDVLIVVPRQRPYKYTFSLHTHFFPYLWSLQAALGCDEKTTIECLGGDWLYHQRLQTDGAPCGTPRRTR